MSAMQLTLDGIVAPAPEALILPAAPAVRANDPDTCHAPTIERMSRGRWQALAPHARAHLDLTAGRSDRFGLTDFELATLTDRAQTSIGKRRGELAALGLIADIGDRRPAPSGAMSAVWAITPDGMATYYRLRDTPH